MFDNDIDQSVLALVLPLVALSALPFLMAWLEGRLDGEPLGRPHPWRLLTRACAAVWARSSAARAHR